MSVSFIKNNLRYAEPVNIAQQSFSTDGVLTTTYQDDYIARGMAFQIQRRFTVPGSGSLYLAAHFELVDSDQLIYTLPVNAQSPHGLVYLDTYQATSVTGGTAITPLNINGTSANAPQTTFYTGVTPTGSSDLREYTIGSPSTNQSAGGGSLGAQAPKIFSHLPLVFHFTNQETSDSVVCLSFVWYEIPME